MGLSPGEIRPFYNTRFPAKSNRCNLFPEGRYLPMNAENPKREKIGRMSPTDNELMEDVRDGRVEKLAVLFERYQAMLYNFFLRLTGNRDASADLVQEGFMRVLKYRAGYLSES